jgi:hypothetical protein
MSLLKIGFLIVLHLLDARLHHIKIEAAIDLSQLILEAVVLVSDFFTARWVNFYERRQRREEQDDPMSRTLPLKKIILVICLNYCLFLLLILEITLDDP